MFELKLIPGDFLRSNDGLHICDENGAAIRIQEEIVLQMENEALYITTLEYLKLERHNRGVDENGNPLKTEQDVMQERQAQLENRVELIQQEQTTTINSLQNEISELKSMLQNLTNVLTQNTSTNHVNSETADR